MIYGCYDKNVKIEYDPDKNALNFRKHGIEFALAEQFDYDTALNVEDARKNYGETRIVAYGLIGKRLYVMCFKPMGPAHIRIISLRKANKREEKIYAKTT